MTEYLVRAPKSAYLSGMLLIGSGILDALDVIPTWRDLTAFIIGDGRWGRNVRSGELPMQEILCTARLTPAARSAFR
jgi:hypothetical protein